LDKQTLEIPPTVPDVLDDVEVETLFSVRKSPLVNGVVASNMISCSGALREGTPKVCVEIMFYFKERSGYLFGSHIHL